jgi:hypothetical protein
MKPEPNLENRRKTEFPTEIWAFINEYDNLGEYGVCATDFENAYNEVARLRELLKRAIEYTKNGLFFARSYENKIQWDEIDKLWDSVRDLEKEALGPAPEETQDGATMDEWYSGFSKIERTDNK